MLQFLFQQWAGLERKLPVQGTLLLVAFNRYFTFSHTKNPSMLNGCCKNQSLTISKCLSSTTTKNFMCRGGNSYLRCSSPSNGILNEPTTWELRKLDSIRTSIIVRFRVAAANEALGAFATSRDMPAHQRSNFTVCSGYWRPDKCMQGGDDLRHE